MQQPNNARNVLLLKAGETSPAVRLRVGDYDGWFARAFHAAGVRVTTVHVALGEPLPRKLRAFDAVVMTGSPLSVTQRVPWMDRAEELLLDAEARRMGVLGVCFGHQLLAHAHGGRVVVSPRGREIGSVAVDLTAAGLEDPLFEGVASRFTVQTTHADHVPCLPGGATLLAGNAHAPVQAVAYGRHVRGVQFHPELDAASMRWVIQARAASLAERLPTLLAGLSPSPAGPRILANFLEHFVSS